MSKILTVADVHISDYKHRNPNSDPYFRLHQGSRVVAQNIIKVGKETGCDYIVLAGDMIETYTFKPYVLAEVKNFLYTIMQHFKEGWIIWGNHDIGTKFSEQNIFDSGIGSVLPDNLHYAHQKTITLDGTLIGFNNWQPKFDLTWIPNKVDILFTHATINYSGDSEYFRSQELDESKFDIAFCGDIHKIGQKGKFVSIGVPQKCKMGDSDDSTGIVVDCQTKTWNYVNLNPDNNLMKFAYTENSDLEGWHEDTKTWLVYKRKLENTIDPNTGTVITEWQKIENLVLDSIVNSGLQEIHSEVLHRIKDLDAGEVDFNFNLVRFACRNWRSIEKASIDFYDKDKILLVGENGAGKSSLLSAIKYAFCSAKMGGLTSLKSFIQFGAKSCQTEVEFIYQGNQYKISRGSDTKDCGLWINGEQQKYNNKNDFDKDCETRFPFTKYIDVLIHDQDHNQFIGSVKGEELAEIISKTFKLDRIDTFNETAQLLLKDVQKQVDEVNSEINENKKLLDFLITKLSNITLPQFSKTELEIQKAQGLELQRKNNEWQKFLNQSSILQAKREQLLENIKNYQSKVNNSKDSNTIDSEINFFREKIKGFQDKLIELGGIRNQITMKSNELDRLVKEGIQLRKNWAEIEPGKVSICPTCGQTINPDPETTALLQKRKDDLYSQLLKKASEHKILKNELDRLIVLRDNSNEEYNRLNENIQHANSKISELMSTKQIQEQMKSNLQNSMIQLQDIDSKLQTLGVPEKVELPEGFIQKMTQIESELYTWNSWENANNDKINIEKIINTKQQEINGVSNYLNMINAYINLTGPTGLIYKEIMEKLTKSFNDTLVNYEISQYEFRKKTHLTLMPQYFNNGNWISYNACSGGQKTILDIHFLSKILSKTGLLIFDEFLKHLSPSNHELCIDLISNMDVGCTIISSHMESIQAFNNRTCTLNLTDGITNINID